MKLLDVTRFVILPVFFYPQRHRLQKYNLATYLFIGIITPENLELNRVHFFFYLSVYAQKYSCKRFRSLNCMYHAADDRVQRIAMPGLSHYISALHWSKRCGRFSLLILNIQMMPVRRAIVLSILLAVSSKTVPVLHA